MSTPGPSSHATTVPSASRRAVVVIIGVLLAVHSFLVAVWVMPANPIRDAIGTDTVEAYIDNPVIPFQQSWSVFAPTPRRAGENVLVRAHYGGLDGTDGYVTPWYDITADEDRRVRYLVNPSRFHSATRRLGGNINAALASFTTGQRDAVASGFLTTPRGRLTSLLEDRNTRGATGEPAVVQYLQNDLMLVRFGTMYATARWGAGVTAVEFRVGHRAVPNFSRRKDVAFLDVPFTYYRIGVRRPIPAGHDAQSAFDGYVRPAPADERRAAAAVR